MECGPQRFGRLREISDGFVDDSGTSMSVTVMRLERIEKYFGVRESVVEADMHQQSSLDSGGDARPNCKALNPKCKNR